MYLVKDFSLRPSFIFFLRTTSLNVWRVDIYTFELKLYSSSLSLHTLWGGVAYRGTAWYQTILREKRGVQSLAQINIFPGFCEVYSSDETLWGHLRGYQYNLILSHPQNCIFNLNYHSSFSTLRSGTYGAKRYHTVVSFSKMAALITVQCLVK